MKWDWNFGFAATLIVIGMIIGAIITGVFFWTALPQNAIVEGTVISVTLAPNGPSTLGINATRAWPGFLFWATTNCFHDVGDSVFIRVETDGRNNPVNRSVILYEEVGYAFEPARCN